MKKHFFLFFLSASFLCGHTTPSYAESLDAGSYLSSRFAQMHHDWNNASEFLDDVTKFDTDNEEIAVRSMILAMGSGDTDKAFEIAKEFKDTKKINSITSIFLVVDAFDRKDYETANRLMKAAPVDPTIQFIGPFVYAWLQAAQGKVDLTALQGNTVQLYHGILISDFLDNHSAVEKIIDKALRVEDINTAEIERIADLYGHVGLTDKAADLYSKVLKSNPEDQTVQDKLSRIQSGETEPLFQEIKTAHDGMAQAFHDIANVLSNENNDESARVFAHLALHLAPKKSETQFLLGEINSRHKQFGAAIKHYKSVPKSDDNFLKAQHEIVDIYEEIDNYEAAIALLNNLDESKQNVDTLIKRGDLYRSQKNFKQAIKTYDKAVKKLGGTIPEDYWHLHYVRGISYEQSDKWVKAEKDLQAALAFQPNHPYVLNYLGYAWADQGKNLNQARDMIQRAVDLRPQDGYITDSLGWVLYRMKDYQGAVKWLEKAVELLPYDPTINDHLGDAYWKVGRRLEARFQWERAKNYSDDEEQVQTISQKLVSGLKTANNAVAH